MLPGHHERTSSELQLKAPELLQTRSISGKSSNFECANQISAEKDATVDMVEEDKEHACLACDCKCDPRARDRLG